MYNDCSLKFKYAYIDKLRSTTFSSALLFGSAVDKALNELLSSKNINAAKGVFLKEFEHYRDNEGNYCETRKSLNVQYSQSDLDEELLTEEELKYPENEQKWAALRSKGQLMVESYAKDILPRIKEVLAIQEPISLLNEAGDEIVGFLDVVVKLEDDRVYLLDHKTSSKAYKSDEAGKSPQLILYAHEAKEKYGINGVGFIVLLKKINKNRKKTCTTCGFDGSGSKHKTCPATVFGLISGKKIRCDGAWDEKISPSCDISIILNDVLPATEDLVINTFDAANENIKAEKYDPNLNSCVKWGQKCSYYELCHNNSMVGLVKKE